MPVGGAGLIAGVAVAAKSLKKDIKIIVSNSSDNTCFRKYKFRDSYQNKKHN